MRDIRVAVDRVSPPVGLSVTAELIQLRWGGTGPPLTDIEGRIHPPERVDT